MESNLEASSVRITTSGEQPPSVERVQLRETRSSYFLNINLLGLRKEDIQLEMDKDRCLMIRGEKYSQDIMGMLRWKWRVLESGTPTKPFKLPDDVNVGGIRASFEQGLLHLSMPKLTRNTFAPYHVFHIHSSHLPHRPHHHQPNRQQQEEEAANNVADHKLASISEDAEMKMKRMLSPGHPDDEKDQEDGKTWAATPSNSVQSVDDSIKNEERVSQSENPVVLQEDFMKEKRGDVEERIGKGDESCLKMTGAEDVEAKQGAAPQEEGEKVKVKEDNHHEKVKEERDISSNGYVESHEMAGHPKPFLCGGLSRIFSAIAAIARRKRRCR